VEIAMLFEFNGNPCPGGRLIDGGNCPGDKIKYWGCTWGGFNW